MPEIRASIDIGTNSCLLLVAEVQENQITKVLHDETKITRLGKGVDEGGNLHVESIERVLLALSDYSKKALNLGVKQASDIRCVATSATRDAANKELLIEKSLARSGIHIQVISGAQEAAYSFLGAFSKNDDPQNSLVMDIGGGSTEFIIQTSADPLKLQRISLDIGSVRLTERFLKSDPVSENEWQTLLKFIRSEIEKIPFPVDSQLNLIGVAGTITTLGAMKLELGNYDAVRLDGAELSKEHIHGLLMKLKEIKIEERKSLIGLEPGRADVILAGACIAHEVMDFYNFQRIKVSIRGLRYGLLLS